MPYFSGIKIFLSISHPPEITNPFSQFQGTFSTLSHVSLKESDEGPEEQGVDVPMGAEKRAQAGFGMRRRCPRIHLGNRSATCYTRML
jgi:hypothetical protein